MVQVASFQEEMDQGIECVPDEEESIASGSGWGQGLERRAVSNEKDSYSGGQGNQGDLIEQVRWQAVPERTGLGGHVGSLSSAVVYSVGSVGMRL